MEKLNYHIIIEGDKYPNFHTTVVLVSIDYSHKKVNILFDAGFYYDAELIIKNLNRLKVTYVDYIIISHWHIDHCGVLSLLDRNIFSDSYILISAESLDVILKALQMIREVSCYRDPVAKLTVRLIENKDFFGWTDKISYTKIRALANLTYRTYDCWLAIEKKLLNKKIYVINEFNKEIFSIFSSVKLVKISYHTYGDLMLILSNGKENILISGDVIPYKDYQRGVSTIFDLEQYNLSHNDLLENIINKMDIIIPSHGRPFYK